MHPDPSALYLVESFVGDRTLAYLAEARELQYLTVDYSRNAIDALHAVANRSNLVHLSLRGASVHDQDAPLIRECESLLTLVLDQAFLTESVLQEVAELKYVVILSLNGCDLGKGGVSRLSWHA